MKKKAIIKVLMIFLISLLLECGFFNFSFWYKLAKWGESQNIIPYAEDVEYFKFDDGQNYRLTQQDSYVILNNIFPEVKEIQISFKYSTPLEYLLLFYNQDGTSVYDENKTVAILDVSTENTFVLPESATNVRVDFGETPGIEIKDITVCYNPLFFDFSVSRIVAMNAIYWMFVLLFALQKNPEYTIFNDERK